MTMRRTNALTHREAEDLLPLSTLGNGLFPTCRS
jgi:hypothetical protein